MVRVKTTYTLLFITISLMVCSCGAPIYDVDKLYTPLYKKSGDVQLEGNFGIAGLSGTFGFAISDNIAFSAHGNYFDGYTNDTSFHKQRLYEGLVTYFTNFQRDKQLYITAGFAHCKYSYDGTPSRSGFEPQIYEYCRTNGDYDRYSLQGIYRSYHELNESILGITNFSNLISARISFLDHKNHYMEYVHYNYSDTVRDYYSSLRNETRLEVSLAQVFPLFNIQDLTLTTQYGLVFPIYGKENFNPYILSFGISYVFHL